jgi:hypothetical protein
MNDVRAVVNESLSSAAVGRPALRMLVNDWVRSSGLSHPPRLCLFDLLPVGLPSGVMNGLVWFAFCSIATERIDAVRATLPLDEMLDRILRSLRFEPVRSDLSGEGLPADRRLVLLETGASCPGCQSPGLRRCSSCEGEAGAE